MPSLERLLSRASLHQGKVNSTESVLLEQFNIVHEELPVAKLLAKHRNYPYQEGFWLCADLVELKADLVGVYLMGYEHFDLTEQEANALQQEISNFLEQDNIRLWPYSETRWLLQIPKEFSIQSIPPHNVLAKEIRSFLIQGKDASYWQRLQNELQMLLHTHAINQQREATHKPLANGVWLWGAGYLNPCDEEAVNSICYDDDLCGAIASYTEVESQFSLNQMNEFLLHVTRSKGRHIIYSHEFEDYCMNGDLDAWFQALASYEHEFFTPLLNAMKSKRLSNIQLWIQPSQYYSISQLPKWWQRRKSIDLASL